MTLHISNQSLMIQDLSGHFAAQEIAGRNFSEFPMGLWRMMGEKGLLGLGISETTGGIGGNTIDILLATEALAREGHNFGMAFSMMIHIIVTRLVIGGFADKAQKALYMPELASGKITASLAISEPDAGNHPKNLKTTAAYRDGFWHITGEKTYLSNGPIAELFIVLAVTDIKDNKKKYTAFIIPADTPGLTRIQPPPLKVFRPSPHCGIKLDNCKIPDENILGEKGEAYRSIAIPFRDAEDLLIMGPILGGMNRQMEIILDTITTEIISSKHELKAELGWLKLFIHAIKTLTSDAAVMIDSEHDPEKLTCLLLAVKVLAGQHLDRVEKFFTETGLNETPEWKSLMNDLHFAVRLAENIRRARAEKQGNLMLNKKVIK